MTLPQAFVLPCGIGGNFLRNDKLNVVPSGSGISDSHVKVTISGAYTENALRDSQKSTVPENMPSGNFPVESRTKSRETCKIMTLTHL